MKGTTAVVTAVVVLAALVAIAKAKEPPAKPVPPGQEPVGIMPLKPKPGLEPKPQPVTIWRWHDDPVTGAHILNPRTGQIVTGLPRHELLALFRENWISPTYYQVAQAERRYRAPGTPRY